MGRIVDVFNENKSAIVPTLTRNFNHIVLMLTRRQALSESEKYGILQSSQEFAIRDLFYYIEVNDKATDFINVLNQTENHGIAKLVRYAACNFTQELKNEKFEIGTDFFLKCEVDDDLSVNWFKGGIELFSSRKYRFRNNGLVRQLLILNPEEEDEGEYLCECGSARTVCHLKSEDLKLINKLENTEVDEDNNLQLRFTLNKKRDVMWTRNKTSCDGKTECSKSKDGKFYKYCLRIERVKRSDEGHYCAFNTEFKTNCIVRVKEKSVELENTPKSKLLVMEKVCKEEIKKKDEQIDTKQLELDLAKVEIVEKEDEIRRKDEVIRKLNEELVRRDCEVKSNDLKSYEENDRAIIQEPNQCNVLEKVSDIEEISSKNRSSTLNNGEGPTKQDSPITQRNIILDLEENVARRELLGVQNTREIDELDDKDAEIRSQIKRGDELSDEDVKDAQVTVSPPRNADETPEKVPCVKNGIVLSPPMMMDITKVKMQPFVVPCELLGCETADQRQSDLYRYSLSLTKQMEELKQAQANASKMQKEIDRLKGEKQELLTELAMLNRFIHDNDLRTENLLKEMKEEHKKDMDRITKMLDDQRILHQKSPVCVVS